jgi:hypothetical protein
VLKGGTTIISVTATTQAKNIKKNSATTQEIKLTKTAKRRIASEVLQ